MPPILRYIAANARDPGLTVASLADNYGASVRTVQKLFRDEEYQLAETIRRTRIALAKRDLRDPLRQDRTIARIAMDCGFDSASHFARLFRRLVGCTPREYRHGLDQPPNHLEGITTRSRPETAETLSDNRHPNEARKSEDPAPQRSGPRAQGVTRATQLGR